MREIEGATASVYIIIMLSKRGIENNMSTALRMSSVNKGARLTTC